MADETKTEHVTLRLKPSVKKLLTELCKAENRSLANMVETMALERAKARDAKHKP